jgi:hypothetical protein
MPLYSRAFLVMYSFKPERVHACPRTHLTGDLSDVARSEWVLIGGTYVKAREFGLGSSKLNWLKSELSSVSPPGQQRQVINFSPAPVWCDIQSGDEFPRSDLIYFDRDLNSRDVAGVVSPIQEDRAVPQRHRAWDSFSDARRSILSGFLDWGIGKYGRFEEINKQ